MTSLYYLPPPLLNDYFMENSKSLLVYSVTSLFTFPIFIYFTNLIISPKPIVYDIRLIPILTIISINQLLKTLSTKYLKKFILDKKVGLMFSVSEKIYALNSLLVFFTLSTLLGINYLYSFSNWILLCFILNEIMARLIISTGILFINLDERELRYYIEALLALIFIELMFLIHALTYLIVSLRTMKILNDDKALRGIKEFILSYSKRGGRIYFNNLLRKYPVYREILISLILELFSDNSVRLIFDNKSCVVKN